MQSSRTQPKEWVWRLIRFWAHAHSFGQTQIPTLTPNLALWLCAAFLQIHCFISEISQTYRKNSWCNDTPDGLCASNYKKNQITIEETKQARKVFAQSKTFHFYSLPKQSAAAATTRKHQLAQCSEPQLGWENIQHSKAYHVSFMTGTVLLGLNAIPLTELNMKSQFHVRGLTNCVKYLLNLTWNDHKILKTCT